MRRLCVIIVILGFSFISTAPKLPMEVLDVTFADGRHTTDNLEMIKELKRLEKFLDPIEWDKLQRRTQKEIYKRDTIPRNFLPAYDPQNPFCQ